MSVSIRLSRGGAKKRPYYRIVVASSRSPRDGAFIERIGSYNPMLAKDDAKRVVLDTERAKHWLSVGAQPSDRVARFLDAAGVRERVQPNNPNKGLPGDKAKERAEERATKVAEAAEAAAAPAPVEEPAAEPEATEEAAPAVEATNEGGSVEAPAEGSVEAAPAEDAETAVESAAPDAPAEEVAVDTPVDETAPADDIEKTEG